MEKTKITKYFGDVEIAVNDCSGIAELETTLNGQEVRIALWSCYRNDRKDWVNNLPFFWEVVDKYIEINEKAKKAIIEYYDLDEDEAIEGIWSIKYFFSELFGYKDERKLIEIFGVKDFQELDIKKVVANMHYPDLTIYWENGIEVCVCYGVSELENWNDKRLYVDMDKELNITGFTAILD